jgi:hypothetical protein
MVMVELGEPGTPLICWASTGNHQKPEVTTNNKVKIPVLMIVNGDDKDTLRACQHRLKKERKLLIIKN